jgi:cytochrome P450
MTPAAEPVVYNPFDPAFRANPYPFYARLRQYDPVHRSPIGITVLSRYDDVSRVLRSPKVSRDVDESAADLTPEAIEERASRRRRGAAKSMLNLDPPDHTRMRGLVNKAFTPSAIEALRPRVRALVTGVLDRAAEAGELDLIDELAFPVPFQVISNLLAMPTERADELREWSQAVTWGLEPTCTAEQRMAALVAGEAMVEHLRTVIEDRRRNLGDDVLSALIIAEEAGDRLTEPELISTVVLLYIAGHETTVNLIGNSVFALLQHPGQRELWRRTGSSLDANAVDELLRFDGPVQHTIRVPLQRMEFEGGAVEAGHRVLTLLGSANHDPSVFEDADELRLERTNTSRHLAFAAGIHYCLGSSLARLEAQEAVGALVHRFAEWELAAEPTWRDRLTIRGVEHLSLHVR